MRIVPTNRTGVDLDLRIALPDHRKKFWGRVLQRVFEQIIRDNVRRSLVTIEQTFEMRLCLPHLLMVHCDLSKDLGPLHLRLKNVLLHPLSHLVMAGCSLDQLIENGFVLPENAEGLLQIG